MEYTYSAINAKGETVQARISADSEDKAIRQVQSQGYYLLSLNAAGGGGGAAVLAAPAATGGGRSLSLKGPLFRSKKVKFEQVVALTRELALLIESGVPIIEAIDSLCQFAENETIRDALTSFKQDLNEGKGLADSMANYPKLFPSLYITLVRTAEISGSLDETLNQAAEYQEAILDMQRKVKGAMTYPVILFTVMIAVVIFMLVYIIPQFETLFTRAGAKMPLQTQILLVAGLFLRQNWWTVPIAAFCAPMGIRAFLRHRIGKEFVALVATRMPGLKELATKIILGRLMRTMGTLLRSGISMPVALEMAAESAQNPIFMRATLEMRTKIEEGRTLASAMSEAGVFPPLACQTVAVGEKSGRISHLLLRVSHFYEKESEAKLKMLSSIIEPVMIIALGVVVGFMAVSIIGPIYSLMDTVK